MQKTISTHINLCKYIYILVQVNIYFYVQRKTRSVIAKVSRLVLILLLAAERETQRSGIAPMQPQGLFQPLLL